MEWKLLGTVWHTLQEPFLAVTSLCWAQGRHEWLLVHSLIQSQNTFVSRFQTPPHCVYDSPWSSFEDTQLLEFVEDLLAKAVNSEHLKSGLLFLMPGNKQLFLWTIETDLVDRKHLVTLRE